MYCLYKKQKETKHVFAKGYHAQGESRSPNVNFKTCFSYGDNDKDRGL